MLFETKRLSHALDVVAMVIENRNTIPVLGCARIHHARPMETLEIVGTDLDIQIRASLHRNPKAPDKAAKTTELVIGACMQSPARVARLIRAAGDEIEISQDANEKIHLKGGPLEGSIGTLPFEDFPAMDISDPANNFNATLGFQALDMILRVAGAVSTEETRYYLNGVYLHHVEGWTYKAVATDGHRLHVGTIQLPDVGHHLSKHDGTRRGIIIPRKVIGILKRLRPRMAPDQPIRISAGSQLSSNRTTDLAPSPHQSRAAFTFHAGDLPVEIITKLIDGTFPDYTRVIPTHDTSFPSIAFARRDLAAAVDAISAGMVERTKAIKLTFQPGGKLVVSGKWIDFGGEAQVSISAQTNVTQPFEVGYNGKYLRQIIDATTGEFLSINVADGASPGSITDPDATDFRAVLMPMRI